MTILGVQSPQNLSKPSLFDEPDLPRTRGVEFWRYNMTFMQHCSTYSASIMSDLLISSKVVAIALPMFMVML